MTGVFQDLRYALRMLAKAPGFTAVAVITLALGIGANSAIFSVMEGVLLKPLPYPQADRIMFLSEWSEQIPDMSISMANFNDWRAQNKSFENMGAFQGADAVWTGKGDPERLRMRRVSAGFTSTLQVQPILGRTFGPDDDKVGAERAVLLGEGFWERRFARDPQVIGEQMTLDGEPYTIIGVLPSRLHGSLRQVDVFTSLWRLEDRYGGEKNRGNHPGIYAYGRLRSGVTVEQARADMKNIAARLDQLHPDTNGKDSVTVRPLLDAIVEDVRPSILVLMAAVGFVLLIACANMANLLLSRSTERYREMAVRVALGAGRRRLLRQMLTESVLLSLAGGMLGLLLAVWVTAALAHSATSDVPRLDEVGVDRWALAFTLALSVGTGIFFGLFPALQASQTEVQDALKEGGRTSSPSGMRRRMRDALVAAEVGVSLVLLVGAGLLGRSLYNVLQADAGFAPEHVLTARFSLPDSDYKDENARRTFISALTQKLQAIPGVEAAGVRNPLLGGWQTGYGIAGRPLPKPGQYPSTDIARVTPDVMVAMGMRLLKGRYFSEHDNENSQRVCIIDDTFARQNFPKEDPVGQRISIGPPAGPGKEPPWMTVVGVVAHVKNYGVDQPSRVETYIPQAQNPSSGGSLLVRTSGDAAGVADAVREAMRFAAPNVPLYEMRPLSTIVEENTGSRRLSVMLIGSFAVLALVLAAVGIYGVMAYSVTQRNHEIGVRMALGAAPAEVRGMIVRQGMKLATIGILAGVAGGLALTRLIASLLFRVSAFDAGTFLAGIGVLAGMVWFSTWFPARRASRVDPMVALRYE